MFRTLHKMEVPVQNGAQLHADIPYSVTPSTSAFYTHVEVSYLPPRFKILELCSGSCFALYKANSNTSLWLEADHLITIRDANTQPFRHNPLCDSICQGTGVQGPKRFGRLSKAYIPRQACGEGCPWNSPRQCWRACKAMNNCARASNWKRDPRTFRVPEKD